MTSKQKVDFYDQYSNSIQFTIKSDPGSKSLWRKLYWTTIKGSSEYKAGCVDIYAQLCPKLFNTMSKYQIKSNISLKQL